MLSRKGVTTDTISRVETPWDVLYIGRMNGLRHIIEGRNAPGHRIACRNGRDIISRAVTPRNVISHAGTASDVSLHMGTPQVILSRVGTASDVLLLAEMAFDV